MSDSAPGSAPGAWMPPAPAAPTAPPPIFAAPADASRPRATGWTPPPKRGLVPLRPIPFGAVLGAPFRLQRRTPRTTLAPALVVSLATTVLASVVGWALVAAPQAALDASYYDDYLYAQSVLGVYGGVAFFVPLVLAFGATALLGGVVAVAASRAILAERVSWRGALWRLSGRIPPLVGWAAIVLATAAVLLLLGTPLPLAAAVSAPYTGGFLSGLVMVAEFLVVLLAGGYLAARLGFVTHVLALEGLGMRAAVARSWRLTRRAGWRLWAAHLAVWVIVGVASGILSQPIGWVLDLGSSLLFPNGWTTGQGEAYLAVRTVVVNAVVAVMGAFGLVLQTVTGALLYLDTRMRAEGLDLALARYADERQRGVDVPDPFPSGGIR